MCPQNMTPCYIIVHSWVIGPLIKLSGGGLAATRAMAGILDLIVLMPPGKGGMELILGTISWDL